MRARESASVTQSKLLRMCKTATPYEVGIPSNTGAVWYKFHILDREYAVLMRGNFVVEVKSEVLTGPFAHTTRMIYRDGPTGVALHAAVKRYKAEKGKENAVKHPSNELVELSNDKKTNAEAGAGSGLQCPHCGTYLPARQRTEPTESSSHGVPS